MDISPCRHNTIKCDIVYTDASDNACGAELSQEHDGQEFQLHSSPIHSQIPNGNGTLQNRKPMTFAML